MNFRRIRNISKVISQDSINEPSLIQLSRAALRATVTIIIIIIYVAIPMAFICNLAIYWRNILPKL